MKTAVVLIAALVALAGSSVAGSPGQHVVQTAADRVVAEDGRSVCVFVGPVNEQVFISCKIGQEFTFTQTDSFAIGVCRSGSFNGGAILWKLCRPTDTEFDWDVTAGAVEQAGLLF